MSLASGSGGFSFNLFKCVENEPVVSVGRYGLLYVSHDRLVNLLPGGHCAELYSSGDDGCECL